MSYLKNIFDFGILPIMALYGAYTMYGILGLFILLIFIVVSLFYIFSRNNKYTTQNGDWKTIQEMSIKENEEIDLRLKRDNLVHERKSAELFVYLYLLPLSLLVIIYFYFNIEKNLLFISIFLLYLSLRNMADTLDESYRVELRLYDEEFERKDKAISELEESLNNLKVFTNRLSIASGYDEKKIREIEDIKDEVQRDKELYEAIKNYEDTNEELEIDSFSYTINKDDNWEDIIWKWADAYKIPSEIIPREKTDLLNLTSLNLTPYSVNPILSMNDTGHIHKSNESIIDKVPSEIFYLENLTELDFDDTNIDNLPIEISNLTKLQIISIANTNISKLPKEIGALRELKYLNISGTKIDNIPETIKKLPNLEILQRG